MASSLLSLLPPSATLMGYAAAKSHVCHHLRVMWEANCSCRSAGYSEGNIDELAQAWGDGSTCSGLPSQTDVPTQSQAEARASAAELLRILRELAGRVWPDHPAAAAAVETEGGRSNSNTVVVDYADREVLQAKLAAPASSCPPSSGGQQQPADASGFCLGETLYCFNPACTNLAGPSELALATHACGGGCGARYCSPACQIQGWRDGHMLSCGRLARERGAAFVPVA